MQAMRRAGREINDERSSKVGRVMFLVVIALGGSVTLILSLFGLGVEMINVIMSSAMFATAFFVYNSSIIDRREERAFREKVLEFLKEEIRERKIDRELEFARWEKMLDTFAEKFSKNLAEKLTIKSNEVMDEEDDKI